MNNPDITYEEFINELRNCTDDQQVHNVLDNQGDNFLNDLLTIIDSFTAGNKYFEAEKILQILANAFNEPAFYSSLALSQKKQYKYSESRENYKKSISLDPSLFKIFYNYGILLCEMKEYDEAIEAFNQSLKLNTDCYLCYYNLGNCYKEIDNYSKAKEAYEMVLHLSSEYEDAYYNLGVVEEELKNTSKAMEHYDKAIKLNYNNVKAHWNKSLLYLQNGDFINGFNEYEWRLKKKEFYREFPFPEWQGEDLSQKKLLIYCEQGLGDAIQFVRFAKFVNAAYITVECRKELMPLFESIKFINEVVLRDSYEYKFDSHDYYVSVMSLPNRLGLELKNLDFLPYIKADVNQSNLWKEKINNSSKYKIGIVCSGNPYHANDENRSIDPELLLKSIASNNLTIYSLQINPNEKSRLAFVKYNVIDCTDSLKDFSNTAALIDNLDLIISVDTSVAHLSGAMGKETWILLPYNPDWRWQLNKIESPWYRSVKLFRQNKKNEWDDVLKNLSVSLEERISSVALSEELTNNKIDFNKIYSDIEIYINQNELDKSLKGLEYALSNDKDPYRAFNYLGILFAKTKNYIKAEEYFLKTLNINPTFPDALSNLGIIYFESNRYEESILVHKKATEINSGNSKLYFNLAYAYQEVGELEKATTNYEKSLELDNNYADAQFNLALLKLLMGNYQDTWADYNKWAFVSGNRTIRNVNKPIWKGELFTDKKLYIYPDQGLGDVIQLVRYLPMVKELGGEVIFECQPAMYDLLKSLPGFDRIVKMNSNLEINNEYDIHIPLQNLPEIFKTNINTIPNYSELLKVSKEANQKWESIIHKNNNYKIGFAWKGNPHPPINRKRHASFEDFIPLFGLREIDYFSLQVGDKSDEVKEFMNKYNIFDFTNEIENFEDTAGLINNLDLIISIDTSVAHLAGAMGEKVFTLLPLVPDWRWGVSSDSTPWYPSMKLFRQTERGSWRTAIEKILIEINKQNKVYGLQ